MFKSITKDDVLDSGIQRIERFGCIAKTSLAGFAVLGIGLTISGFNLIEIIGSIGMVIVFTITTIILWYYHLKEKEIRFLKIILFTLDILGIQIFSLLLCLGAPDRPEFGLEHPAVYILSLGIIISSAFINQKHLPLYLGGMTFLCHLFIFIFLLLNGVPLHTGNSKYQVLGHIPLTNAVYRLLGIAAIAMLTWFFAWVYQQFLIRIESHNKVLLRRNQHLRNFIEHSRKVIEMGAKMKETVLDIHQNLLTMQVRATKLEIAFQQQVRLADTIELEIREMFSYQQTIRDRLNEQSSVIKENTEIHQETTHGIQQINQQIHASTAITEELVSFSQDGILSLQKLLSTNNELAKAFETIENMLTAIVKIAKQTNLLALNASIEAAHAGEAGAGFAVVADEVRGLAENASKTSSQITDQIHALKATTEAGIKYGEEVESKFHTIKNKATAASEEIQRIADHIQQLFERAEELAQSSNKLVQVADTISEISINQDQSSSKVNEKLTDLVHQVHEAEINLELIGDFFDGVDQEMIQMEEVATSNETLTQELEQVIPKDEIHEYNPEEEIDGLEKRS